MVTEKVHYCYFDERNLQVMDVKDPKNYNRSLETDIHFLWKQAFEGLVAKGQKDKSGRSHPLYYTTIGITMQGHQDKSREHDESRRTMYLD